MPSQIFSRLVEQGTTAREDSDFAYLQHLLTFSEFVVKLSVSGLLAAIADDSDRHRYRQLHALVRADGVGDWSKTVDEIVGGSTATHLVQEARVEQRELSERVGVGTWQYMCVQELDDCMRIFDSERPLLPTRLEGRRWFAIFAELRNRTRGHGATKSQQCSHIIVSLEASLSRFVDSFSLFRRDWAYLHRNLSGKYRVTAISVAADNFSEYKSSKAQQLDILPDGVYVYFDRPRRVETIFTDPDLLDVYVPNGKFSDRTFEALSYLTDSIQSVDSTPYLLPIGKLPKSETEGLHSLDAFGETLGNLPPANESYVHRPQKEREIDKLLKDDRHAIITLTGRGGIGKTSLALSALHSISNEGNYGAIFWFSSRDIDLLPSGPKPVRPQHLNQNDIAKDFAQLLGGMIGSDSNVKPLDLLASCMQKSPIDRPLLFVFDNFETVNSPSELFAWIDTFIRLPNKALITTRSRGFKADWPVEIYGMEDEESDELITKTGTQLNITELLLDSVRKTLRTESDGHPYVLKILLGEAARSGSFSKIERIMASKDDILDALFERSFVKLSPGAQQVFLTLCAWRSIIAKVAIESVLLRPANERLDVESAIEELVQSSFIEAVGLLADEPSFLLVPMAAAVFGRKKLAVSPYRVSVEANLDLLQLFGAAQRSDARHGIGPGIERFFKRVAERANATGGEIEAYAPMLEYLSRHHSRGWLLLATLYEEASLPRYLELAKNSVRKYLEIDSLSESERLVGWDRLANFARKENKTDDEMQALLEICQLNVTPIYRVSSIVNRWNEMRKQHVSSIATDERTLITRRLLKVADTRLKEADATTCSRFAWLCLSVDEVEQARNFTMRGLDLEADNLHCLRLKEKLATFTPRRGLFD